MADDRASWAATVFGLALLALLAPPGRCEDVAPPYEPPPVFNWLRENGGYINKKTYLTTDDTRTIRGMYASARIDLGDDLLRVPWGLVIHGAPHTRADGHTDNACTTVLKLREELIKGEESFYYPHIASMSEAPFEVTVPNIWPEIDRKTLLGDLPPHDTNRHIEWWRGMCGGVEGDHIGERALWLYVNRATASEDHGHVIVAVYDMYNHNPKKVNVVAEFEEEAFVLRSIKPIYPGEELYIQYGVGTSRIFRDYGFVESTPQVWFVQSARGRQYGKYEFTLKDDMGHVTFPGGMVPGRDFTISIEDMLMKLDEIEAKIPKNPKKHPSKYAHLAYDYREAYRFALEAALHHLGDEF